MFRFVSGISNPKSANDENEHQASNDNISKFLQLDILRASFFSKYSNCKEEKQVYI
ncbi:hypothetical protein NT04LM_0972 [Listeria monocytogenes FSL F2-208]|nr:hypothetical protein NT04LM_0972 [Listeria monocytogenes FSL F2-208]